MKPPSEHTALQPVAASSGTTLPPTSGPRQLPAFDDAADFGDYLAILLKRKWLVATFLMVLFVSTLVVSLTMKPAFKASGRIEVTPQAPKVTKFEDLLTSQVQVKDFIQTQVTMLRSESLARRVIEKVHLAEDPAFNPLLEEKADEEKAGLFQDGKRALTELFSFAGHGRGEDLRLAQLNLQKTIEAKFANSLEIAPLRDNTVIALHFSSTDPEVAMEVVNVMIQEFISWQVDKKIDAANTAKKQLEKQLELARINLERSENNLKEFAKRAGIVSLDSRLNLVYRELEETNNALASVGAERMNKEAIYTQASEGKLSSLPMVVQNKLIQDLRAESVKATAEYKEYLSTFREDYPRIKNLKAKMNDINRLIELEEVRILESLEADYLEAVKREQTLKDGAEQKKALALDLNEAATQYKILEREVETNKVFHQSLLERSKEIDAKVGTELGNIQVVDYATLPLRPHKPNVMLNLLFAMVVGLMGGIGLAFFAEYLDNTVKRVEEIADGFRVPILGVLPLVAPEELRELDFIVRTKPRASFAEAIRTSRAAIQLSSGQDTPPRSLLISSIGAEEGKTTIAANLAQAFASYDKSVVLVDTDLRRPRLHRIFGNSANDPQSPGLSQYLSGVRELDQVIQQTPIPNLWFIPSGPIPPNPSELLGSLRMGTTIAWLAQRYHSIILDRPPFTGFADVLELAHHVDAVIVVVTLGQTHREALRICQRTLHDVGGNLLGCIVNKLNLKHHYGGYYYKYYRYYHSYYYRSPYGPAADLIRNEGDGPKA